VPTYLLTDNEKTVTVEHVAGLPVRNPAAARFGRRPSLAIPCGSAFAETRGESPQARREGVANVPFAHGTDR
jgi:hypothetical protein